MHAWISGARLNQLPPPPNDAEELFATQQAIAEHPLIEERWEVSVATSWEAPSQSLANHAYGLHSFSTLFAVSLARNFPRELSALLPLSLRLP